jgi:hypothetical protein
MRLPARTALAAIAGLAAACGAISDSSLSGPKDDLAVFEDPVPRAACGAGSSPETAMQGQVTAADRASGRADEGYWCNLDVLAHLGDQADIQMAWYEDCAYYTVNRSGAGVAAVDVSDPANPVQTASLQTPAMLEPWESLKTTKRGLIGAVWGSPPIGNGPLLFDVWDVKDDCTKPRLVISAPVDIVLGHEGEWTPDGLTYYAGSTSSYAAIDVTNPQAPLPLYFERRSVHGMSTSEDGTRTYLADTGGNGLTIIDTTQIQERVPNPSVPVVGSVYWEDGSTAQSTIPVTIQGKPYVIFWDEQGYGGVRIIDIADDTNPRVVSKIRLEVQMPDVGPTAVTEDGETGTFGYNTHYCGVPQRVEPQLLACNGFGTGMRVYDIRDAFHPKEVAYYNASTVGNTGQLDSGGVSQPHLVDGVVWWTLEGIGPNSGFYTARLSNGAWPGK